MCIEELRASVIGEVSCRCRGAIKLPSEVNDLLVYDIFVPGVGTDTLVVRIFKSQRLDRVGGAAVCILAVRSLLIERDIDGSAACYIVIGCGRILKLAVIGKLIGIPNKFTKGDLFYCNRPLLSFAGYKLVVCIADALDGCSVGSGVFLIAVKNTN